MHNNSRYLECKNFLILPKKAFSCVTFWFLLFTAFYAQADTQKKPKKKPPVNIKITKGLFYEGMKLYQKDEFSSAIQHFQVVHKVLPKTARYDEPRVMLQFFMGICYYHTKDWHRSKEHLERFLKANLSTKRAIQFRKKHFKEARLTLTKVKVVLSTLPTTRVRVPAPAVQPPKTTMRAWPIVLTGIGVAALVGGIVTGTMAASQEELRKKAYQNELVKAQPSSREIAELHNRSQTFAATTNALYIAGGAITVTGLVLILTLGTQKTLPPRPSKKTASKKK